MITHLIHSFRPSARAALVLMVVLLAGVLGCGSSFFAQRDRVSQVKRLAVAGIEIQQEQSKELHISGSGVSTRYHQSGTFPPPRPEPYVVRVAALLGDTVAGALGAQTLAPDAVVAHPAYQTELGVDRVSFSFGPIPQVPIDLFVAPGLARPMRIDAIPLDARRQLLEALGVDALAIASLRVRLNRQDNIGIGEVKIGTYNPSVWTEFRLFDGKGEDAIWSDSAVFGERAAGPVQISGVTGSDPLQDSIVEASGKSFAELVARYRNPPE
jgi:hypothetical protein